MESVDVLRTTKTKFLYNFSKKKYNREKGDSMYLELQEQKGAKKGLILDGELFCKCYPRDLVVAGLSSGADVTQEQLQRFCKEVLLPRAKRRSLALLGKQAYTKQMMTKKLRNDGYPEEVTEQVIVYLERFHYIEDRTFGQDYALYRIKRMSERELSQKMQQKGFDRETIHASIELAKQRVEEEAREHGEDVERTEISAIRIFLQKKSVRPEELDEAKKQKLIMALFRRGFQLSDIRQVFGELECVESNFFFE